MASDHSKRESSLLADRQDDASRRSIWHRIPKGWIVLALVLVAWLAGYLIFQGFGLLIN